MILFFQRYFQPLIWLLLALLGLCLGQLAATAVGLWLSSAPMAEMAVPKPESAAKSRQSLSDYDVILTHNVFDPAARGRGALSEVKEPQPKSPSAPAPAEAPKNIDLLGTVAGGSDPLAMLRIDRQIEVVHLGDELPGGITVERIERLIVQLRHADGSLSELALPEGALPQPQPQASVAPQRRPSGQEAYEVQALGENRWVIPQAEAERARANLGELLKSAHLVPNVVNGSTEGFTVRMIKPNSLLAQLGLRVGDIVMEVNGVELSSPEKALQIFTQLRDARNISLGLVRNGEQLSFDYAVD